MKDNLVIPEKIRVGFQNRNDTYSGKLAFIVSYDKKGKLRSENAWEGWRDHKIQPVDYPNEPTSGFVLNKDVGGTHRSYSWNARREKVRVYDPRGFEFEINVENLLFILQECSSIKGKGLEGDFVYSWGGSQLVLMPVDSQEYKSALNLGDLQTKKISAKEMVEGGLYLTKKNETVMYLGKFSWWDRVYDSVKTKDNQFRGYIYTTHSKKVHIFIKVNGDVSSDPKYRYMRCSGFTHLAKVIDSTPSSQFAEEYDKLQKSGFVSKPVRAVFSDEPIKLEYGGAYIGIQKQDGIYLGRISTNYRNKEKFDVVCSDKLIFDEDGCITYGSVYSNIYIEKHDLDKHVAFAMCKNVFIECENGSRREIYD